MSEIAYTKKEIAELMDGRLVPEGVHRMLSMPKDAGRFKTYLAVLQERVKWKHRIDLPYAARLYVTTAGTADEWSSGASAALVRRLA
jgi:acetone carboxylase gamma subunit